MTISVIIPAYNVEKYIERSLNSVLKQTFKPFEIIVVDDGSTDATSKIITRYNHKVSCVFQTNQGSSSARNHGIRLAKGDWIAFLDSDDEWIETHLENFVKTFKLYPDIKWYGAPFKTLEEKSKKEIFKIARNHLKQRNKHTRFMDYMSAFPPKAYLSSPTMVVHKSIFTDNDIGYFDTSKKTAVDLDMWFRIGLKFPKFGYSYQIAAIVYRRDFSLSTSKNWQPKVAIQRFLDCQIRAKELGLSNRAKPRINYWVVRLLRTSIKKNDIEAVKEIQSHFSHILPLQYRLLMKAILKFPFLFSYKS